MPAGTAHLSPIACDSRPRRPDLGSVRTARKNASIPRKVGALSVVTALSVPWKSAGVAVAQPGYRTYAVATEHSANYGLWASRTDVAPTCNSMADSGFVYSAMWQGVNNGSAIEWVETGTSYCDWLTPGPTYLWAKAYNGGYFEAKIENVAAGSTHSWMIAASGGNWAVWLDGVSRASTVVPVGSNANSEGDVGLEVYNRQPSTLPETHVTSLDMRVGTTNWVNWSGRDADCVDAPGSGGWGDGVDDLWKYSLNSPLSVTSLGC